jgi:hypothetical protein
VPPLLVTASTKHPGVDAFHISQLPAYLQHPPSRQETAGSSLQAHCRRCSPFPGVTEAVQADYRTTTLDEMAATGWPPVGLPQRKGGPFVERCLLCRPHLLHRRGELLERLLDPVGAPHGHGARLVACLNWYKSPPYIERLT